MLNVFLTVDTEVWPYSQGWPVTALPADKTDFARELDAYIHGRTPKGDFGIPYQMALLNQHGLKATYFVEALFGSAIGLGPLREIVQLVRDGGHEVQLHLHTEWLREIRDPALPAQFQQHIRQFSLEDQTRLIARGVENLIACGATDVCAFRAGNFGANFDTLRALAANGLKFDSSHNTCYLDTTCQMPTDSLLLQPREIEGVWEYPVSFFVDYPGHYRHAQLCACSFPELRNALLAAWREEWHSFVIVFHGFELLKHFNQADRTTTPEPINLRRFRQLCEFLGANRDKFHTAQFAELDPRAIPSVHAERPLNSPLRHTARRYAEQAVSRFL